jgi:hypothetical protein
MAGWNHARQRKIQAGETLKKQQQYHRNTRDMAPKFWTSFLLRVHW